LFCFARIPICFTRDGVLVLVCSTSPLAKHRRDDARILACETHTRIFLWLVGCPNMLLSFALMLFSFLFASREVLESKQSQQQL